MSHFLLTRDQIHELEKILDTIPGIVDDLAITLTRQDRVSVERSGKQGKARSTPLPFHVGASQSLDALTNVLGTWIRHVHEERGLALTLSHETGPAALSVWLRRNINALAATEGADEALADIRDARDEARRCVDIPSGPVFQGVCEACTGDLKARSDDKFVVCTMCGLRIEKVVNDSRIAGEIDARLFTTSELVILIRARFDLDMSPRKIAWMTDPRRKHQLLQRGINSEGKPMYRAGDVFALLRKSSA